MSKKLEVKISSKEEKSYNIVIEQAFDKLPDLLLEVFSSCNKFMLVFDSNTDFYFKEIMLNVLKQCKSCMKNLLIKNLKEKM